MGIGEAISRFTESVGDTINTTFTTIGNFIDSVITFFVSAGFWVSVLVFFALFFGLISIPLILFKYWDEAQQRYKVIVEKILK